MKKDAYYFSHDSNARHDPKILKLRTLMGWEGYALYFSFLEICREQQNYMLEIESKNILTLELHISVETLDLFFKNCLKVNLLKEENGFIFSESFMNRMRQMDERRQKYSEAGKKGGKAKALASL